MKIEAQIAIDTEGAAYIELGRTADGEIRALVEGASEEHTWSREEAAKLHSLLGHLLYG